MSVPKPAPCKVVGAPSCLPSRECSHPIEAGPMMSSTGQRSRPPTIPDGSAHQFLNEQCIQTGSTSPPPKGVGFCTFCEHDERAIEWRFGKRVRDSVLARHGFRRRPKFDLMLSPRSTSCRPHVDLTSSHVDLMLTSCRPHVESHRPHVDLMSTSRRVTSTSC